MRIGKFMTAVMAAAFIAAGTFTTMAAVSEDIDAHFYDVSLDEGGHFSWNMDDIPGERVDKYEIVLSRYASGRWNDTYKKFTTDENSYDYDFSASGKYCFRVRAKLVGGDKTVYSEDSNIVIITSEDVGPGGGGGGGSKGPGYEESTVPSGPGSSGGTIDGSKLSGTGWISKNGKWVYKYIDGSLAKSWRNIDGSWYFFEDSGYMKTGWLQWQNNWYYLLPDGKMATGMRNVNEKWYYLNESGIMQTGYVNIGGKIYLFDGSGARFQGGWSPDGHQFDADGVMIR